MPFAGTALASRIERAECRLLADSAAAAAGRGVQSALLGTRLEVAAAAGCDVAVVTTQPGSKSQENAQRQGFELLYTRTILVRTP